MHDDDETNLLSLAREGSFSHALHTLGAHLRQGRHVSQAPPAGDELLQPAAGEEVLIIGAGTGADLPFLPSGARITAIDLTPAMLARLEQRAAALGHSVQAHVMDGQALSLPSNRYDAVILHLILAVFPDPVACIREAERVLKPGGRLGRQVESSVCPSRPRFCENQPRGEGCWFEQGFLS